MNNFTDTYIKRLQPQDKRLEKFEGGGFGILVYPAGTKSWIYRYKIDNKKDYIIFGHYPGMSLAEARKRFNELRDIRRTGVNPKQLIEQEINRKQDTVEKLVESWYIWSLINYNQSTSQKPWILSSNAAPLSTPIEY